MWLCGENCRGPISQSEGLRFLTSAGVILNILSSGAGLEAFLRRDFVISFVCFAIVSPCDVDDVGRQRSLLFAFYSRLLNESTRHQ